MTALATAVPRFDIGRVIQRAFSTIQHNWQTFGLLALILTLVPYSLSIFGNVLALGGGALSPGAAIAAGALSLLGSIAYLVGSLMLQGSLIHGVVADLNGRKASLADCLSYGRRYFLPLLGLGILMGLALVLGFLLLVVPGVLMALAWLVAAPVIVAEGAGVTAAMSRSADLTRGHRWALFGLIAIFFVAAVVLGLTAVTLTGGFKALANAPTSADQYFATQWPWMIFQVALQTIQNLVGAVSIACIYIELRLIKEGVGADGLAAVFD